MSSSPPPPASHSHTSIQPPISTPTHGLPSNYGSFSILAKTTIAASPLTVLNAIRDTSTVRSVFPNTISQLYQMSICDLEKRWAAISRANIFQSGRNGTPSPPATHSHPVPPQRARTTTYTAAQPAGSTCKTRA